MNMGAFNLVMISFNLFPTFFGVLLSPVLRSDLFARSCNALLVHSSLPSKSYLILVLHPCRKLVINEHHTVMVTIRTRRLPRWFRVYFDRKTHVFSLVLVV